MNAEIVPIRLNSAYLDTESVLSVNYINGMPDRKVILVYRIFLDGQYSQLPYGGLVFSNYSFDDCCLLL